MKAEAVGAWPAGRLPIALLAVIAAAYKDRMDGDAGRTTWRTDQRFTQCGCSEARTYLWFLESTGYELAAIERAVADQVPYTGEQPEEDLTSAQEQDTCAAPTELSEDAQGTAEDVPEEADATHIQVPAEAL